MEITGSNVGASTFAMKQAMEMPNILLNLIKQSADSGGQSLETKAPISSKQVDLAAITGKGKIIDLVA